MTAVVLFEADETVDLESLMMQNSGDWDSSNALAVLTINTSTIDFESALNVIAMKAGEAFYDVIFREDYTIPATTFDSSGKLTAYKQLRVSNSFAPSGNGRVNKLKIDSGKLLTIAAGKVYRYTSLVNDGTIAGAGRVERWLSRSPGRSASPPRRARRC